MYVWPWSGHLWLEAACREQRIHGRVGLDVEVPTMASRHSNVKYIYVLCMYVNHQVSIPEDVRVRVSVAVCELVYVLGRQRAVGVHEPGLLERARHVVGACHRTYIHTCMRTRGWEGLGQVAHLRRRSSGNL